MLGLLDDEDPDGVTELWLRFILHFNLCLFFLFFFFKPQRMNLCGTISDRFIFWNISLSLNTEMPSSFLCVSLVRLCEFK